MKIERLAVDSFLGIKRAQLDFTSINIVAGDNWSGKSSLQQALRVAMAGEVARVKLKGQYSLLVREGAKKSAITAYLEGGIVQDASIPLSGKAQIPNCDSDIMKIALDQQRFVSMSDAEKRKVIFDLYGNLFSKEKIVTRMLELGADAELVEQIKPLLQNEFDVAFQEAESKAKEYRALWKSVTGETYGVDKAEKWEHQADVEAIKVHAGTYAKLAKERNSLSKQRDEQQKVVDTTREEYLTSAVDYTCKKCKHKHEHDVEVTNELAEKLKTDISALDFITQALSKIEYELNSADASAEELKTIEAVSKAKTESALNHHKKVVAWSHIKELVSESGVMSEIVADALQPLNKRLAHNATISTFGQVAIHSDMSITIDNRLYGLCSEAQQWLAQAALCEAIAYVAGLKFVILDRIDVLSVANRGKLIAWCFELSQEVQFILFGTLKFKPELKGITSFWVENGEVQ